MPSPYKDLIWAEGTFSVVKLSGELLTTLQPKSKPNVLAVKPAQVGSTAGAIKINTNVDSANFKSISFACVEEVLGTSAPVGCTVAFTNTNLAGTVTKRTATYDGGSKMADVALDFNFKERFTIKVTEAGLVGDLGSTVSVVLDNFYYEATLDQ